MIIIIIIIIIIIHPWKVFSRDENNNEKC